MLVEFITFLLISLIHIIKLPFNNFDNVLTSYFEALVKNHFESKLGMLDILVLWINSLSTNKLPLNETMMYFWEYKITWVGLGIIIVFILSNYYENRQGYYD
jgi:hypothetical protein